MQRKFLALKALLQELPGAVIGFSGGVDSTFLVYVAHEVLKDRIIAVTAVSDTYPEHQLDEARQLAAQFGINHEIIKTNEFDSPDFTSNPSNRCYYCKKELFSELKNLADKNGWVVLDGANLDDCNDYRPGHKAAAEMGVRSPLKEAGLTKAEIRELSKDLGLPTWNKQAYACLASRIPYGTAITAEALKRIDQAETFLASLGLKQMRVRDHFPVARIEVDRTEMEAAWRMRDAIKEKLRAIGFPYVAIDLDGFRSGSMNEVLK